MPVKKTLSVKVVDAAGKTSGTVSVPETVFGVKENKQLIAQAVRVYLANQRVGTASTKTRGEVEGSTRKIYKQKGTGRARHGAIRAPIFVGGGIVFGPKPHSFARSMPKKMKRAALVSALSQKLKSDGIRVVSGLETIKKTKKMAQALQALGATASTLLVIPKDAKGIVRVARNLENVDCIPVSDLHTYGVLAHNTVVFTKEAIKAL